MPDSENPNKRLSNWDSYLGRYGRFLEGEPPGPARDAGRIRHYVLEHYIEPAREEGRGQAEVLVVRLQLGLEPPHLAGRYPAALNRLAADDPAHRGITPEPVGVVDILVASETPIDGLAKETNDAVPAVPACAAIRDHAARECTEQPPPLGSIGDREAACYHPLGH